MVHRCSYALWSKLFRFLVSRSGSNSMPCCARTRSDNIPCQFKPVLAHLSELLDLVQYLCFLMITSSARLPRALCQHIRPPSPNGDSPLQPGCLKHCVNTEDLRLRTVAHLFNPAVSSIPHDGFVALSTSRGPALKTSRISTIVCTHPYIFTLLPFMEMQK